VDLQRWADSEQARVEGDVVAGAGGQAVPGIQVLAGCAVFPRLDVPGHQHVPGAERRGVQLTEDATLAAVAEHIQDEHVLPDPGRGQAREDKRAPMIWALAPFR